MTEVLYHLLGICGEHNHPHLINMGFLATALYVIYRIIKFKYNYEQK